MAKRDFAVLSSWTTGSGIVIGTNINISGVWIGTAATTLTLKLGTASLLTLSGANTFIAIPTPIGVVGSVNGTSSGGSFAVAYSTR